MLGDNTVVAKSVPTAVIDTGALSGKVLVKVNAGTFHTCALDSNGASYCWGWNGEGALGNGNNTQSNVPAAVVTSGVLSGKVVSQIRAGTRDTCATTTDGVVACWGYNDKGQLGVASTGSTAYTSYNAPVVVSTQTANSGSGSAGTSLATFYVMMAKNNSPYLWAPNGKAFLVQQSDDQFVEYECTGFNSGCSAVWVNGVGSFGAYLDSYTNMQSDGNLVTYGGSPVAAKWALSFIIAGSPAGSYMVLTNTGTFYIARPDGSVFYTFHT